MATKKKKGVDFGKMSGWQKTVHVIGYIGVVGIGLNIVTLALGGAMIGGALMANNNKTDLQTNQGGI